MCVHMSSFLHLARLTNTNMSLGNGKRRTQLLGADYRLGTLRLDDGLRAGGVRRPYCTARCTWLSMSYAKSLNRLSQPRAALQRGKCRVFTAGRMLQCDTPQCTAVPPGGDSWTKIHELN